MSALESGGGELDAERIERESREEFAIPSYNMNSSLQKYFESQQWLILGLIILKL